MLIGGAVTGLRADLEARVLGLGHPIGPGHRFAGAAHIGRHLQEVVLVGPVRLRTAVDDLTRGPGVVVPPLLAPEDAGLVPRHRHRAAVCDIARRRHDLDHAAAEEEIGMAVDESRCDQVGLLDHPWWDLHALPHMDGEAGAIAQGRTLAALQPAAVIALQQRRALTEPTHMRVGNNPAGTLGDSHDMTEGWHLGWIDTERNEILTGGQPGIVGIEPSAVAKAPQAARTPPLPQSGPKSSRKLIDGSVDDLLNCLAPDHARPHPNDHRIQHAGDDTRYRAAYDARKR